MIKTRKKKQIKEYRIKDPSSQTLVDFKFFVQTIFKPFSHPWILLIIRHITVMENSVVVLLLSVFILFGALYVHIVDQRIMQRKDELPQPAKSGCCDSCPMYADLKAEVDGLYFYY